MTRPSSQVSTDSIDYLQRCAAPEPDRQVPLTAAAPGMQRLLTVSSVGRPDTPSPPPESGPWRPRTAELLTGLYGHRIPVFFRLDGDPAAVRVRLGTWSGRAGSGDVQDRRRDVLQALLGGIYSLVRIEPAEPGAAALPLGGVALGGPDPLGPHAADGAAPVDRVIASLAGTTWSAVVLAYPVPDAEVTRVRQGVLNE